MFIENRPTDYTYKGLSAIRGGSVVDDWESYLPVMETQVIDEVDSWFCPIFSTLNALEVWYKYLTGEEKNWSDMYLGLLSGTEPGHGNSVQVIMDTMHRYGNVLEAVFAFVAWNSSLTVPEEVIEIGKEWLEKYEFRAEIVRPELETYKEDILDALQYSPLVVGVKYANGVTDNEILNPIGTANHLVLLFGHDKQKAAWKVMDSYQRKIKYYNDNYRFAGIVKFDLRIKENVMFKPISDQLYVLTEGKAQLYAIGFEGKLMVYENSFDAQMNSLMRRRKALSQKTLTINDFLPIEIGLTEWRSVEKINGKGEPYIDYLNDNPDVDKN